MPWIGDDRPWAVLVSEVMLQQTQTSRVIERWREFLERFPTPSDCADAPLSEILALWQGLGYPRRAKSLHDAARVIRDDFAGLVPSDLAELRSLPGIGDYTAAAVASFAFGRRVAVLDTNVGRVLARAVANRRLARTEAQSLAQALLPRAGSATFNQAMLDLGAQFCRAVPRCDVCPVVSHCHWRREGGDDPAPKSAAVSRAQSAFAGSNRELRGRVMRVLITAPATRGQLNSVMNEVEADRRGEILAGLLRDGLIAKTQRHFHLAESLPATSSASPSERQRTTSPRKSAGRVAP
jgi:A/G-specific adenine glycosylase